MRAQSWQYIVIVCYFSCLAKVAGKISIIDDSTTPELAEKNGYSCESHRVISSDGYILELHRLFHGKARSFDKSLPPVLLQHGLLASSADWLIAGPSSALGYILADLGYDVWLGNARGNTYSKSHVRLSPDNYRFWNFTWHEMGVYDLPATIDYILAVTRHPRLHYVGHSMGTTMFFVMAATRPEYNSKILHMAALAPAVFLTHSTAPIRLLLPFANEIGDLVEFFDNGNFVPRSSPVAKGLKYVCSLQSSAKFCSGLIFLGAGGYDSVQFNTSLIPLIFRNDPAGSSVKALLHFGQQMTSKYFRQYDYGPERNMMAYHSKRPPSYDLSQVSAPVTLMYGVNDIFVNEKDVYHLYQQLQNSPVELVKIDSNTFNHIDFTFARDVRSLVYDHVIYNMKRRENFV